MDVITNDDGSMEADSTLTYSLLGIDEALFDIDSITGQITFINSPDFETPLDDGMDNVYNIAIVVCDDADPMLCDTQAITISVTNDFNDNNIRLLCVNPINDQIIIKNFGTNSTDISNLRLCSKFSYTNNGIATDMNVVGGTLILAPGDSVVLNGFSIDDTAADLGLYAPIGAFTDSTAMLDFTQWGSAGNGRESVAVAKGIWSAGDFRMDLPEYCYIGDGKNVSVIIDVQKNDLDFIGDGFVTTVIGTSTEGVTPTVLNDDSISYTPPTNFLGTDTLTYQICYQNNPNACDTTIVLVTIFPDSDGDGVPDDIDLDDDNDGIPDLDECPFVEVVFNLNTSISNSTELIYEAMVNGQLETVTVTRSTNPQSLLDSANNVSPNGAVLSTSLTQPIAMRDDTITEAALTFTPSLPVQSIRLTELSDMDRRTGNFPTDAFGFTVNGFWTIVSGDLASYDVSTQQLITNNPAGNAEPTLTATNNSAHEMLQKGVLSPILVRGTIGETNNSEVVFTSYSPFREVDLIVEDLSLLGSRELIDNRSIVAFITVGVPLCDLDGDNIPNYLDKDSDGDGCSDAMEAGHLINQQADSTIAGPYGSNGLADAVETNVDSDTLNYNLTLNNSSKVEFLDSLAKNSCNEAPIIVYAPDTIYNDGNTNVVMDIISIDDVNSELDSTLTYSLLGIDSALFTIDSITGQINFINPPSVDNPLDNGMDNVYNISVVVCDAGRIIRCDTQAVVVTVSKDNDGDGILDITDLDDDNDGILDWDECTGTDVTFTYNNALSDNTKLVYTATIAGVLEMVTITATTTPTSLLNPFGQVEPNGTILTPNGGNGIISMRDDTTQEAAITFTSSTPIIYIKFEDLDDMDRKLGDLPSDAFGFTTTGYWRINSGDLASYDPTSGGLIVNNPNGDATPNLLAVGDSGFEMLNKKVISGILTRGTIGETNNAKADFIASAPFTTTDLVSEDLSLFGNRELITNNFILQFLTVGIPDCDPDNDGIPNYFDLDSDGDGCPDALEAGHGISMRTDSTIAGPYGNNGVADTLENNDSQTALANYTITETNAGTFDFLDNTITLACLEICGNGMDDDGDGKTDCEDTDCMPIQLADTDTLTTTTYCLALPFADTALYTILLDGSIYTPVAPGCDFDQIQGYGTLNFSLNSPPYNVTWMYNNNPENTTVNSVTELVTWMNTIDTDADWSSDALPNAIAYTQRNNSDIYGPITFPNNSGTVTTNINTIAMAFGTTIEVGTLANHQIIINNKNSGCADTIDLVFNNEPPLITYAPDTTFVENDTSLVMDIISTDDTSSEVDSTLKYSLLTAGLDEALFTIDSITGQIRFITPPDFENPQDGNKDNVYDLTVVVCDAQNLCDPEVIAITVTNDYNDDGIRLLCVNPNTNQVTLKNFGLHTIDISNHRLCSKFSYTNSGLSTDMNVISGSLILTPGDSVTLDGFNLDELGADLGLYAPTGSFVDTLALLDFTQWKSAGNGRESVAVAKGIWGAGDFRVDFPTYCYIGNGVENGVNFWDGREAPIATNDTLTINENQNIVILVQNNDNDIEDNGLTTTVISTSTAGINPTVLNEDSLDYTPPNDFVGIDTITYQICDNGTPQLCDTAVVFITILLDSDGDNIADETDLDDDNDGILDTEETATQYVACTYSNTNPTAGQYIQKAAWSKTQTSSDLIHQSSLSTNYADQQQVHTNTGNFEDVDPTYPNMPWNTSEVSYITETTIASSNGNYFQTTDHQQSINCINSDPTCDKQNYELFIDEVYLQIPPATCIGNETIIFSIITGNGDGLSAMYLSTDHNPANAVYVGAAATAGGIYAAPGTFGTPPSNTYSLQDTSYTPFFMRLYNIDGVDPNANGNGQRFAARVFFPTPAYSIDGGATFNTIPVEWIAATPADATNTIASIETWTCNNGNCTSDLGNTSTEATLISSGYPSVVLDIDTDSDGIPNRLDLDSDKDGCPDAVEAGHNITMQADSTIAGPYGNNGLAASVENSDTDTATINYTIDETTIGMLDFLNDQIQNGCDQIITLKLRVLLQGGLFGGTDTLMRDDLRSLNLIPLEQPYTTVKNNPKFAPMGGVEQTTNALLAVATDPSNSVVDWVFLEFRETKKPHKVFLTTSALVQRDGDVMADDGGELTYTNNLPDSFLIAVKHRNHLGVMTANPLKPQNGQVCVDFTNISAADLWHFGNYDGLEMVTINGKKALWAGNSLNNDNKNKYDGRNNDRQAIGNNVLGVEANINNNLNFGNGIGYYEGDLNLDGLVKYDGANNDRLVLQSIILNYPLNFNGKKLNNFDLLLEQLP